jgi:WD40 repeat protein
MFEQIGRLTGHVAGISGVKLSHKGDLILTAGDDGTARIWNTSVFDPENTQLDQPGRHSFQHVTFNDAGDRIAATARRVAYLWNLKTGRQVQLLSPNRKNVSRPCDWLISTVFSPDERLLLLQVEDVDDHKLVEVYNSEGTYLISLPGELNPAERATFTADSKFIALTDAGSGVIWNIAEKTIVRKFAKIANLAFSPDGKALATCTKDGLVQLWSFPEGRQLAKVQIDSDNLYQVGFSPNGKHVFVRDDAVAQWLWQPFTQRVISLASHEQVVMRWGFSDDNSLIFTYDLAEKTLVQQTTDGKLVSSFSGEVLATGCDSKFLIDSRLSFWETYRGKLFSKTIVPYDYQAVGIKVSEGRLIAFSSNGRIITRPLDEFGPLDEVMAIAIRRAKASQ